MYSKIKAVSPYERRQQYAFALWLIVGLSSLFTFWQLLITYQSWSINRYLLKHENHSGSALVTSVARITQRGGTCGIYIAAEFTDPSTGKRISVMGPGPHGVIGKKVAWMACRAIDRPSAYQKALSVGDNVEVVYAVSEPSVNRPVWIDYDSRNSRVWLMPWISVSVTFGVLTLAIFYTQLTKSRRW